MRSDSLRCGALHFYDVEPILIIGGSNPPVHFFNFCNDPPMKNMSKNFLIKRILILFIPFLIMLIAHDAPGHVPFGSPKVAQGELRGALSVPINPF